jgi:prepilin signal peptidase PulO-like enzyme (type II secretory pathway)
MHVRHDFLLSYIYMNPSAIVILFAFGVAIGSFLNVVATRYDGEHFLFSTKLIGGRSHCEHCKKTLRWFELVPLASFIAQGGRCRRCKARLSIQYPIVELLSGIIFVSVPLALGVGAAAAGAVGGIVGTLLLAVLWIAVFEMLLVMTLIDIRLGIIPDEINISLATAGVLLLLIPTPLDAAAVLIKIIAALGAGVFFALLIAVTRGKGMGMGDLKLAIPLGLLFGWPDIILVLMAAFVIGAVIGVIAIARGTNSMKGTLPFGPFLALGAVTAFFWGAPIIGWYLSLLGVR